MHRVAEAADREQFRHALQDGHDDGLEGGQFALSRAVKDRRGPAPLGFALAQTRDSCRAQQVAWPHL